MSDFFKARAPREIGCLSDNIVELAESMTDHAYQHDCLFQGTSCSQIIEYQSIISMLTLELWAAKGCECPVSESRRKQYYEPTVDWDKPITFAIGTGDPRVVSKSKSWDGIDVIRVDVGFEEVNYCPNGYLWGSPEAGSRYANYRIINK